MPQMKSVEEVVRLMHQTGQATRDLMAKTTVASGAIVGGPVAPVPAPIPPAPTGAA